MQDDSNHKDQNQGAKVSFTGLAQSRNSADKTKREGIVTVSDDSPSAGQEAFRRLDFDRTDPDDKRKVLYKDALQYLDQVSAKAKAGESFALDKGIAIVDAMVEVNPFQNFLYIMALHQDYGEAYISNHPVNVAILSIKLSAYLGFSRKRQVELGLAALLHDIGSVMIPEKILYKTSSLSKREFESVRERPNYSYRILEQFQESHPYLPETALQVYERIDGSGYPRGLKGDEIHEYAQIIGLVDFYEALIHNRPQRERFLHFTAIKEIISTGKHKFKREYLKALLNIFSIFPIYSYVKLNSGAIGRVIETYPDQPMRPKIQLLYDSQKGRLLTDRVIDLPEHPLLYIVDSLDEVEIESMAAESSV